MLAESRCKQGEADIPGAGAELEYSLVPAEPQFEQRTSDVLTPRETSAMKIGAVEDEQAVVVDDGLDRAARASEAPAKAPPEDPGEGAPIVELLE